MPFKMKTKNNQGGKVYKFKEKINYISLMNK